MSESTNSNSLYNPNLQISTVYSSNSDNVVHPTDVNGKIILPDLNETISSNDNTIYFTTQSYLKLNGVGLKQKLSYAHIKDELVYASFSVSEGNQWTNKDQINYDLWANGLNLVIASNPLVDMVKKDYGFAYSQAMPTTIANFATPYSIAYFKETLTPRNIVGNLVAISFIVHELNYNAETLLFKMDANAVPITIPTNTEFTITFEVGTYDVAVYSILNNIVRKPVFLNLEVTNPILTNYQITPFWKFNQIAVNQITTGCIIEKNGTADSLLWDFGDNTNKITTNNAEEFNHFYTKPGIYQLSVTATVNNQIQPIVYLEKLIVVEDSAIYNLVPVFESTGEVDYLVSGKGYEINGKADTIVIDFGDGSTPLIVSPFDSSVTYSHIYNETGVYEISMVAMVGPTVFSKQIAYPNTVITNTGVPVPYNLTCDWNPKLISVGEQIKGSVLEYGIGRANKLIVNYGDGEGSITVNNFYGLDSELVHIYKTAGTYRISITPVINNVTQITNISEPIVVALLPSYKGTITWNPSVADVGVKIVGTLTEINGNADSLFVDFGDNLTATFNKPDLLLTHVYSTGGNYVITVIPSINKIVQLAIEPSTIKVNAIVVPYSATFVWNPNPVLINNIITGTITEFGTLGKASSLTIDYGDGTVNVVTDVTKPITYAYKTVGSYNINVKPTVNNVDYTVITNNITVLEKLPNYTIIPVLDNYEVTIGSQVTGTLTEVNGYADSFTWYFGDNSIPVIVKSNQPVTHTYTTIGIYQCLVTPCIGNTTLDSVNCKSEITVTNLPYSFTVNWLNNYAQINTFTNAVVKESNGVASSFFATYDLDYTDGVRIEPAKTNYIVGNRFNSAGKHVLNLVAYGKKLPTDATSVIIGSSSTNPITVVNNKADVNDSGYKAVLIIDNLNAVVGKKISMRVGEYSNNASSFFWDFGDGISATYNTQNAEHVYIDVGSFYVSVIPVFNGVYQAKISNLDPVIVTPTEAGVTYIYQNPDMLGKIAGDQAYAAYLTNNPNDPQKGVNANVAATQANKNAFDTADAFNTAHGLTAP